MKSLLSFLLFVLLSIRAFSQDGTVVVYRAKSSFGSGLKPSIYVDDKQVARLVNGRYVYLRLAAGKHSFESSMKSVGPLEVVVKPTATSYLEMVILNGGRLIPVPEEEAKSAMLKLKPLDAKWTMSPEASGTALEQAESSIKSAPEKPATSANSQAAADPIPGASAQLSGTAVKQLTMDQIQEAIRCGENTPSPKSCWDDATRTGGLYIQRTVSIVTDFQRIELWAHDSARQGRPLDAKTILPFLHGRVDLVLKLVAFTDNNLQRQPIAAFKSGNQLIYPDGTERVELGSDCTVFPVSGNIQETNRLDLSHFCDGHETRMGGEARMWHFGYTLPEEMRDAEVEVVITYDNDTKSVDKFDLSKIR